MHHVSTHVLLREFQLHLCFVLRVAGYICPVFLSCWSCVLSFFYDWWFNDMCCRFYGQFVLTDVALCCFGIKPKFEGVEFVKNMSSYQKNMLITCLKKAFNDYCIDPTGSRRNCTSCFHRGRQ